MFLTVVRTLNNDATAQLTATVTEFNLIKENAVKPYAMYTIEVKSVNNIGYVDLQKIFRRYSDFYALQEKINRYMHEKIRQTLFTF